MNATERRDGRWASLHSKPLFEYKMAAGNVYRAALALQVQKLGYEIEKTGQDGRFELSAVREEMRELFATRREEIKSALMERGLSGARSAAKAALMTRGAKEVLPRDQLAAEWAARSDAAGFNLVPAIRKVPFAQRRRSKSGWIG
jgi:conjugative relaxase-like TrwC/TraI family protein